MLTQPRCPECGLQFEWAEVLDSASWHSDFLFEHHWRRRFFRSWVRTVWRSFRPFRFWRNVSIHDRIHSGPLWGLLLTSVLWFCVAFHGLAAVAWATVHVGNRVFGYSRPWWLGSPLSELESLLRYAALMPLESGTEYLMFPGLLLGVVLAVLGSLCCFRQSLGRSRVRTVHILRVVAYASTPVSAIWGVVALAQMLFFDLSLSWGNVVVDSIVVCSILLAFPVTLAVYLTAGLKRYVRLPRSSLLAIAATVVAFLFVVTATVVVDILRMGGWG
jgi:hypothetical protein